MTGELTSTVPAADPAAYIRKFESEQADFAVYLAALGDLTTHTSNTSNPHSTTAGQVGAPTTAQFTGHTGITSIHFTQSEISIPSSQINNFTEAVQDVVGGFVIGQSGITVLYNDASNTLSYGLSGNLFTGITGHLGSTNVHFTQASISITSTQVSNFTEAVQDVVGVNSFTRGVSGIHVIYNDASNTLTFGLTGNLHTGLTGHLGNTNNPHATTAAQVGAPTTAQFTGHTGSAISHVPVFTRAGFLGVLDGSSSLVPVPIYNDTVAAKPIEPTDVFIKFDTVNDDLDSATIQDLMDYIATYFGLSP
jgi:hypothetical protein